MLSFVNVSHLEVCSTTNNEHLIFLFAQRIICFTSQPSGMNSTKILNIINQSEQKSENVNKGGLVSAGGDVGPYTIRCYLINALYHKVFFLSMYFRLHHSLSVKGGH